jgi:hypothetical protein
LVYTIYDRERLPPDNLVAYYLGGSEPPMLHADVAVATFPSSPHS